MTNQEIIDVLEDTKGILFGEHRKAIVEAIFILQNIDNTIFTSCQKVSQEYQERIKRDYVLRSSLPIKNEIKNILVEKSNKWSNSKNFLNLEEAQAKAIAKRINR